jgi:hypothetical protein
MTEDEKGQLGRYAELFAKLADRFADEKVRDGRNGQKYYYITKEQAMNRLDDSIGPANWWYRYKREDDIVNCVIYLCLPDGTVLDRAGCSPIDDDDRVPNRTRVKGAYSDSFKTAAEGFGVGRYIKGGWAGYARRHYRARDAKGDAEPEEPEPATTRPGPSEEPGAREFLSRPAKSKHGERPGNVLFKKYVNPPYGNSYLEVLNHFGALRGFPDRIVNWSAEQCREAEAALERGNK